jgi:hypothetical protein
MLVTRRRFQVTRMSSSLPAIGTLTAMDVVVDVVALFAGSLHPDLGGDRSDR